MKTIPLVTMIFAAVLLLGIFIVVLNESEPATSPTVLQYAYTIINSFHHDPDAFTEGLVYSDGFLYEGTGLNGASSLRRVNLTSGEVLQEVALPNEYFGEGIAIVNNRIVQLTYVTQIGFVYDKNSFGLIGNFSYETQGWGLAYDGKRIIMSDGTDNLYFLDPETYQRTGELQVHDGNESISNLNELEYIKGEIYANIFEQDNIAIINPETGQVKGWIDLSELTNANRFSGTDVLNGIAYDIETDRLFVTGKNWPRLYEIKLVSVK